MTKKIHIREVWGGDSLQEFFENIINHPSDYHVYDCSKEFDVGNLAQSMENYSTTRETVASLAFKNCLENLDRLYSQNPDVRNRVTFITGATEYRDYDLKYTDMFDHFGTVKYFWNSFLYDELSKHGPEYYARFNREPEHLLVSMNNRPHPHRQSAYIAMKELGLVDDNQVSWCGLEQAWHAFCQFLELEHRHTSGIPEDVCPRYCETILADYPRLMRKSWNTLVTSTTSWEDYPTYNDSLIDIVVESSPELIFFTEKTFRPIINGKPFVILGAYGQNEVLQSRGFALFDNLFDFSAETDYLPRIHIAGDSRITYKNHYKKILAPLVNCDTSSQGLKAIRAKCQERIDHNTQVICNMIYNDDYLTEHIWDDTIMRDLSSLNIRNNWYYDPEGLSKIRALFSVSPHVKRFVPRPQRR